MARGSNGQSRAGKASLDGELMRLLRAVEHGLQSASKVMARDGGATAPQRSVLKAIARQPGISAGDVAALVHLHASTVTGILHRLIERGLVVRKKAPGDARKALLEVTDAGRKAGDARGLDNALKRALGRCQPAEVEAALRVLGALADELTEP